MQFGIIGSGAIARVHAQAIRALEGSSLRSIYGRNRNSAGALAAEFGCAAGHDLEAFLADPALDIVTIATPSGHHLEPALAAIRAGKHVICEKPLEVTTGRIDAMNAAAAEHGVTLAGIFNRRFHPTMAAMRQAAGDGRFGRMVSASAYVKWFRDQAYYDSAPWRGTWELDGGGALMNQAIHAVDQLLWLAGPVRAVGAGTACLAHDRIEVEDHAVALLEFESGARGVVEASTACWSSNGHPVRIQLAGTRGSAFLADDRIEAWDFAEPAPGDDRLRAEWMQTSDASEGGRDPMAIKFLGHQRNFEDVAAAIREGREPLVTVAEARRPVELIAAIYHSAAHGGARTAIPAPADIPQPVEARE